MTTEQQKIGELIHTNRKKLKITLKELGKNIGVGQTAIYHYEKGDTKVIPFDKRLILSAVLGIPLRNLLYETELKDYDANKKALEDREAESEYERLRELLEYYKKEYESILTTPNGKNFFQALYNRYTKETCITLSLNSAKSFTDVSETVFAVEFYLFMLNNLSLFLVKNTHERILLEEFFNIFFPQAAQKVKLLSYSKKDFIKYAAPEVVINTNDTKK